MISTGKDTLTVFIGTISLARADGVEFPFTSEDEAQSLPSQERSRSRSRPVSHADSVSSAAESEDVEDPEEGFNGPHTMQGGAVTDDVYRWAHQNKRKLPRRARSESLHMPRTSTIDPDLDASAIKVPGGFRYVIS